MPFAPLFFTLLGRRFRGLPVDGPSAALLLAELTALFASTVGHGAALWWLAGTAGVHGLTIYAVLMAAVALISLPLLSPLGDRSDKRRLVVWGQALLVVEAVALVLLAIVDGLGLAALCGCGALATVANAVIQPARSAQLLDVVAPARLAAAIRVRRGAQALGTLGGPAVGGLALASGGTAWAFGMQALLAIGAWVLACKVRPAAPASLVGPREDWRGSVRAGLRAKWLVRVDRWWSLAGALMMVFFLPATGMLLPLRLQAFGASPAWLGLCSSALSVGVLAGVLGIADRCMARLGRLRAMASAIVLCGLSLGGVGVADGPGALVLCFGVIGVCLSVTQLMGQTHRSLAVPEDFRARMAAAQLTLSHLAAALAPLLAGMWLQRWPVAWVYGLMSAGFLLSGLALLVVPDLRTFLGTPPAEVSGWYERRYPHAFQRRTPIMEKTWSPTLPHFILHHSANLSGIDVDRCLTAVNAALAASGHFEEIDIKSRAFQAEQFLVGVEARGRAFVAGTLSVLTGRSDDTRREMGAIALRALVSCIPATSELHIQVSVEVVEIQRETYAKAVIAG
ncbi:MFS transporter [Roseateles chitinivorans]|uniref:MFS transporter n=1 Tax=Roseateles chitinivorans TaxID=2917965 RepID=UPI003D677126